MVALTKCGWYGTLKDFLLIDTEIIMENLQTHQKKTMNEKPGTSQVNAWKKSILSLKNQIKELTNFNETSLYWHIIFEYELPRERGRRPDIVILAEKDIFILEFKGYNTILQSHVDQVAAYSRDIQYYHSESHNYHVHPILVINKYNESNSNTVYDVSICDINSISQTILQNKTKDKGSVINVEDWLNAEYDPLPSLVTAARYVFRNEKLPNIKRAMSAGIPDTIQTIINISRAAIQNSERHPISFPCQLAKRP